MEEREAQHKRQERSVLTGEAAERPVMRQNMAASAADPVPDLGFGRLGRDRAKRRRVRAPRDQRGGRGCGGGPDSGMARRGCPVRPCGRERKRDRGAKRDARLGLGFGRGGERETEKETRGEP